MPVKLRLIVLGLSQYRDSSTATLAQSWAGISRHRWCPCVLGVNHHVSKHVKDVDRSRGVRIQDSHSRKHPLIPKDSPSTQHTRDANPMLF